MSYRYKILCTIHGYQEIWSDTLPTTCPINAADPVNQDMTYIDGMLRPGTQISPTLNTISFSQFTRVGSAFFDTNSMGVLKRIGLYSYCDEGVTSYTVEVYDRTNLTALATATFSNTNDYALNYVENVTELSSTPVIIEIFISVNTTIANKNAYVSRIILFCY